MADQRRTARLRPAEPALSEVERAQSIKPPLEHLKNEYYVFDFTCLKAVLAQSFLRAQGICLSLFILSCPALTLVSAESKAKPFQTHPNPFFQRPNLDFRQISRIFDKFYNNLFMQNKANFVL